MQTPKAPANLDERGAQFWRDVAGNFRLRPDELRTLEDACREIDLIERMNDKIRDVDLTVSGSMGQLVANPLVQEVRQHRAILSRLLASLKLPDESGGAAAAATRSESARAAAVARWGKRGA